MASDGVTNWKAVSPEHRKKINPIVQHYGKMAHPFTACVNDITGKTIGGKPVTRERAERICAVVKDMGERTTKWRKGKGGGKMQEAAADEAAFVESLFDEVMAPVLEAEGVTVVELADWAAMAERAGILEAAPTGALALELSDEDLRDLALLEAPTAGQRLAMRAKAPRPKTRGGGDAEFEKKHPRGRGGEWTVKAGAKGAEVRAIQRRVGGTKVDGQFGQMTKAAVMRFQRKHGLQVDGVVGRQTVAAMRGDKDAKKVKPGAMTDKDRSYLSGSTRPKASRREPAEDSPDFNWRKHGNGKRGVILKDGSRRVVDAATFDRLKREGKLSSKSPRLKGD